MCFIGKLTRYFHNLLVVKQHCLHMCKPSNVSLCTIGALMEKGEDQVRLVRVLTLWNGIIKKILQTAQGHRERPGININCFYENN